MERASGGCNQEKSGHKYDESNTYKQTGPDSGEGGSRESVTQEEEGGGHLGEQEESQEEEE